MDMHLASVRLSQFVAGQAARFITIHGITWCAVPDAPDNWEDLYYAYLTAKRRGTYLPVSNLHCDTSIYTRPEVNHACRYWHDMMHCVHGLDFSLVSEIQVGRIQSDAVMRHFGKGSVEHLMMLADTVGQSIYESANGCFPENQREFVYNWVTAHKGNIK